jgi:hypothetical protein
MDSVKTSRHPIIPYLIILAAGFLAHGMLLLNDGKYMEGWFLEALIEFGNWEEVRRYWVQVGYPFQNWLHSIFVQVPIVPLRSLTFTWILLAALFQYKILIRFTPLTEKESLFVTIFALVWPFYHLLVWSVFASVLICWVLFYAGWYYYLCLKEKKSHPLLYLPALTLMFLSLTYPVFLTYHLAFLLIYALSLWGYSIPSQLGELKTRAIAFLKQNWIPALMPFAFYILKNIFYPVTISYNKIHLFSLTSWLSIFKNFFRNLTEPIFSIFYSIPTFWFVMIPVLLAASFLLFKYFKSDPEPEGQQLALGMIGVGLILIVTLSITYGLVWKTVKIMSAKARYAFGANLAFSLVFLGGIHWLFNKFWSRKRELIQPVLYLVLTAMVLVDINFYAMWQARWARTASIIHNLKQQAPIPNANVYFLKDGFPLGVDTKVYASDFTLMMIEAWNQHQYIGITPHYQRNESKIEAARRIVQIWEDKTLYFYGLVEQFNPKGCFAEVVVSPNKYHQEVLIGFRYLYLHLFKSDQMPMFLEDLTEVKIRPLNIDANNISCS